MFISVHGIRISFPGIPKFYCVRHPLLKAPLVNFLDNPLNIAVLSDTFHDIMKPADAGVGHHADA